MTPDRTQEDSSMAQSTTPGAPTGGPATPPRILPWLLAYTLGRLVIAVALIALIWLVGLPGFPALLFGLLLSMPVALVLLRPVRDRLTEGLAARSLARRTRKEELRARLSGDTTGDGAA
ncbi:uncharacterized protein DUF4229 [Geodermatophilus normandii]|uniref:Uncharacterized protein DUF4229 n=2 Tax=Geodermatophilus normandii TaxID=1137989 RepID=A0A317QM03_9ACTN|nr:uncharacterized protein DUF4229 [Geodermatophilus normandii]